MLHIYHTVSSGVYLWDGAAGLLIDGLHSGTEVGMSATPARFCTMLGHEPPFDRLHGLLFTHQHADHCDRALLPDALALPSRPALFGPGLLERLPPPQPCGDGLSRLELDCARVLALATVHDGPGLEDTPHNSFLVEMGGRRVFFAGDACLSAELCGPLRQIQSSPVDVAFVNLYQLTSASGQAFLRELAPALVLLCHLPTAEDDRYHYRAMAAQAIRTCPDDLPPLRLAEHNSWVLTLD